MKNVRPDKAFLLELRKYLDGSLTALELVAKIDDCIAEIDAQQAAASAPPAATTPAVTVTQ